MGDEPSGWRRTGRAPFLRNPVTWQWDDHRKTQLPTAVVAGISAADKDGGPFRTHYLGNATLKPQEQQNKMLNKVYSQVPHGERAGAFELQNQNFELQFTAFELQNHQELRQTFKKESPAPNACRI